MTPLHHFGSLLRNALAAVPLPLVRGLFLLTFVAVLIWVVRLPKSVARAGPDSRWSEDLRLWAAIALLIQIAIYAFV
jgi:hypothetical protein